jgi:hypothetical protein
MICTQCGFEMLADYDYVNRVKVLVCPNPTCLYRVYPDYPRRKGNEEICYVCSKIFRVKPDQPAMLCPKCKADMGGPRTFLTDKRKESKRLGELR